MLTVNEDFSMNNGESSRDEKGSPQLVDGDHGELRLSRYHKGYSSAGRGGSQTPKTSPRTVKTSPKGG